MYILSSSVQKASGFLFSWTGKIVLFCHEMPLSVLCHLGQLEAFVMVLQATTAQQ